MGVQDIGKYPTVKRMFGVPADEPLFILRAQDRLSTPTIALYECLYAEAQASLYGESGVSTRSEAVSTFDDHLMAVVSNFRRWQLKNADKVKMPD